MESFPYAWNTPSITIETLAIHAYLVDLNRVRLQVDEVVAIDTEDLASEGSAAVDGRPVSAWRDRI